jgi:hypothetical protein
VNDNVLSPHHRLNRVSVTHVTGDNLKLAFGLEILGIKPARFAKRIVENVSGHIVPCLTEPLDNFGPNKAFRARDKNLH